MDDRVTGFSVSTVTGLEESLVVFGGVAVCFAYDI